jgi:glucosyl-dolichyl phosphate glucuronosyltransferase
MPPYDVTVLICTWNRSAMLDETLTSVAATHGAGDLKWEVLVVDNNSTDDTRPVVERQARSFPVPLRYAFEPRQGKSCAMNTGIALSQSPLVALIDDDVHVTPEWLVEGCRPMSTNPAIAYTGGPVAPIWEAARPPWFEATGRSLWGTLAILDYGPDPFLFEQRRKIPLGANFALRRSLIDRVGGFDTRLGRNSDEVPLGQELPEFFARTRRVGAIGMYVPLMRVEHHVPAQRVTPEYARRWWYGKGISRARIEAIHPVTELGLDLRRVPTIAGVPRFLFGSAARDVRRWIRSAITGDMGGRLAVETQLWYFAGQVRERFRQRHQGVGSRGLRSHHA